MKNVVRKIAVSLCLVFLTGLTACHQKALYHDLNEEEANEILVVLQQNNIPATKVKEVKQNETVWAIEVAEQDLSRAQAILVANNLPRKQELGLSGVYKEKGLIPTPDEQKARYLLALKGEIINSLKKLPEVIDADVVLNVPTKEEFSKKIDQERPTASVVIKAKSPESGPSSISEQKIQEFVANSIEGMAPRDVSVLISFINPVGKTMHPGFTTVLPQAGSPGVASVAEDSHAATSATSLLMGLQVSAESKNRLKIYLVVFFSLLVLLAAALIVTIIQASRFRNEISDLKGGSAGAIEGQVPGGQRRLGPGA